MQEEVEEMQEGNQELVIIAINWQITAIIAIIIAGGCNNCN
jgi:hypothetical protein